MHCKPVGITDNRGRMPKCSNWAADGSSQWQHAIKENNESLEPWPGLRAERVVTSLVRVGGCPSGIIIKRPEFRVQHQQSRVQSPEFSIQGLVSRVQHPDSSVQSSASRVQYLDFSVQSPASRIQRPESSVKSPASRVQHPTLTSRVQEFWYAFLLIILD